ncbi:hypothetical protein [Streptosporangium sp. NBC_01756]|uniref:hypothetical protein n=1 Tax=Streptosporangium sp. NBC_01756 TaxID=2975950 RepID=UPI002DD9E26E|nr:hypothetical protein [Streptosporangium sp. NBC_01756]WSC90301.1 hypothetical protein OIE48_19610 [Streptosporangium sp. NBC_01756]
MRIRFLAAAVVTTGALMATLTGAASASSEPAPSVSETITVTTCGGPDGKGSVTARRLTEAELKDLRAKGPATARRLTDAEIEDLRAESPMMHRLTEAELKDLRAKGSVAARRLTDAEIEELRAKRKVWAEATGATDAVSVTPAVPATPLDPPTSAEIKDAGAHVVFALPTEEGEDLSGELRDAVQPAKEAPAGRVARGRALPKGMVVCELKDEKAEKAGEPGQ